MPPRLPEEFEGRAPECIADESVDPDLLGIEMDEVFF